MTSRRRTALATALVAAALLAAGCTGDRTGDPPATASPVELSQAELAREWLRTAAAGDESRLRAMTYQPPDSRSGELAALLGVMEELGELEEIEIGRTLPLEETGETRKAIICTRLTAADGRQVDGGVRFVEDDGRWMPWEWLQFVGCQDDQGAYGAEAESTTGATSSPEAGPTDVWVDDDGRERWEAEHGPATWVVGYFLPPDYDNNTFDEDVLVRRWRRLATERDDLTRSELLDHALAALPGQPPTGLGHSWQPYPGMPDRELDLESAHLDGHEVVLDFSALQASAPGSTAGVVMGLQFDAIVRHYYPEAEEVCVLVDNEPSEWLHDMLTCPSRQ